MSLEQIGSRNFLQVIDGAFDVGSVGMGEMYKALDLLYGRKLLSPGAEFAVDFPNSNYLTSPYVQGWQGHEYFRDSGPLNLSAQTIQHLRLIDETNVLYERLDQIGRRLKHPEDFEGLDLGIPEDVVHFVHPDAEEFREEARRNKLDEAQIERALSVDVEGYLSHVSRRKAAERRFGQEFLDLNLRVALYKLGSMLAVTDQVVFDAGVSNSPIPGQYTARKWEKLWVEVYHEPIPTIEQLYKSAFEVFERLADPNDLLIAHLLEKPVLTSFSWI